MARILLTLFIILTLISCKQSSPLTENEKVIIVEDVRHTLDNYYNDIRNSGLTAEFKYLDNTPDFFWVPPGYPGAISYDSVAAVLNQHALKFKSIDNSFTTLRIIPLSKEYATYTGQLKSIVTDTSGTVTTFLLVETGTMIKRKDGWKLLNGQTSILNQ